MSEPAGSDVNGILFGKWDCPLCGAIGFSKKITTIDYNHRIPGSYTFGQCKGCGLWRQQPRPTPETLGRAYPLHYGSSPNVKKHPESRINCYANRKRYALTRRVVGQTASVFDIGCGSGFFLAYLKKRGWDVAGIDSAPEHVSYANEMLGLGKVKTAQWPGYSEETGRYSIVSLIHVLEHLPDPVDGLKAAGELLAGGGYLLIETPNINALARYVYGGRCNLFDAPRHLCLYSTRTIEVCVRKAGFTPVKLITYSPSLDGYRESLRYLIQDKKLRRYRTAEPVATGGSQSSQEPRSGTSASFPARIFHTIEKIVFRGFDAIASPCGGGLTLLMLARKE